MFKLPENSSWSDVVFPLLGILLTFFLGWYFGSWCITALAVLFSLVGICYLLTETFNIKSKFLESLHIGFACCAGLIIIFMLVFHDIVVITPHGSKCHIYKSCYAIKNKDSAKKMLKADAILHGCFSTCKTCKKRKAAKEEQYRREMEEYEDDYDYIPGVPSRYQ